MNSFGSAVVAALALCTLLSTAEGIKCFPGFHEHGSSCYWFSTIKGSFGVARSVCEHMGSHLAVITNRKEDAFVRGYARQRGGARHYYLGGSDLGLEGTWIWDGGKPMKYTNWARHNPNNYKNNEHCLSLWRDENYKCNDASCDASRHFICEQTQ